MYIKRVKIIDRAIKNIRCFTQNVTHYAKNHYKVLEITQNATQNDIKAAYYKLSMVYHPDKNKGSDTASEKFKDITAAYEVLGNYKLRRLYDLGIIHTAGTQNANAEHSEVQEDPRMKFYRSREKRHRPPTAEGKTNIYDFDEWSRAHYGSQFTRQQEIKRRIEFQKERRRIAKSDVKTENVFFAIGFMTVMFFYLSYAVHKDSLDAVDTSSKKS